MLQTHRMAEIKAQSCRENELDFLRQASIAVP
jgi:hypothetical protein